jgi:SET domain-containing protein
MKFNKIEVRNSVIKGSGVFAVKTIRKGETVIIWHPKKQLTLSDIANLSDAEKHYVLPLDQNTFLLMGEPERYVNHSCDPNTRVHKLADVAMRDINAGEEITGDYASDGILIGFSCNCGSKNCKEWIGPKGN